MTNWYAHKLMDYVEVSRFATAGAARIEAAMMDGKIVRGDNDQLWVVSRADFEKLTTVGYREVI